MAANMLDIAATMEMKQSALAFAAAKRLLLPAFLHWWRKFADEEEDFDVEEGVRDNFNEEAARAGVSTQLSYQLFFLGHINVRDLAHCMTECTSTELEKIQTSPRPETPHQRASHPNVFENMRFLVFLRLVRLLD